MVPSLLRRLPISGACPEWSERLSEMYLAYQGQSLRNVVRS